MKRAAKSSKPMQEKPPTFQGWNTSDAEEIERRRWRGAVETTEVESLEPEHPIFGTFRVRSASGTGYEVEIRSLVAHDNSCGCLDW